MSVYPVINQQFGVIGEPGSRFWRKVDVPFTPGSCWTWNAGTNGDGYGTFGLTLAPHTYKAVGAHRLVYEALVGPIPAGMEIDHLCRNRRCVRPDHLEAVSHRVNVLRSDGPAALAARRTACPRGHAYDRIESGKYRRCGQCVRDRYHARRAAG